MIVAIDYKGHSMFPLLRDGDMVAVHPGTKPEVGDIVVFQQDDELICHRVISNHPEIKCKGDYSVTSETVQPDQIVGKVTAIERSGKTYQIRYGTFTRYLALSISLLNSSKPGSSKRMVGRSLSALVGLLCLRRSS